MERVEFTYTLRDEKGGERLVTVSKREEGGLHDYDVCEMFLDFMRSVGFSESNVWKYFEKE